MSHSHIMSHTLSHSQTQFSVARVCHAPSGSRIPGATAHTHAPPSDQRAKRSQALALVTALPVIVAMPLGTVSVCTLLRSSTRGCGGPLVSAAGAPCAAPPLCCYTLPRGQAERQAAARHVYTEYDQVKELAHKDALQPPPAPPERGQRRSPAKRRAKRRRSASRRRRPAARPTARPTGPLP